MSLPPVVIELSAADAASPNVRSMLDACSSAVIDGECRVGTAPGETPRAVVIVSWDAAHGHARVEIGLRRDDKSRWSSRDLDFKDSDPEAERWRSVGLVVGTLVGEAERAADKPAPPPKPTTAPAPSPAPSPAPTPAPRHLPSPPPIPPVRLWIGAEGMGGPALDNGTWRFGAGLIGAYDFPRSPFTLSATARYAGRPSGDSDLDERWFTLAAGGGIHHEPAPGFRVEGRLEAVAERMEATTLQGQTRDTNGRWLPGLRLSAVTGPVIGDWGALLVGAEVTLLTKATQVTVEETSAGPEGRAPALTWGLVVSGRFGVF